MYSKSEVEKATLEYFQGDELPTNVWIDKYCLKDSEGNYLELTPDDMHKRLAKEFARIELKYPNPLSYEEIYSLLSSFKYIIPGGSILYGLGNSYSISSLGNCFVIGNTSDSYGGICTTDQELCQLFKRRSGVGHDISHLRPDGTYTSNAAGYGTGPVSFMHRYSHTARETAQSGRRGAQMITININHPDIEQFITSKDDLTKITGANISIKITDEFMKAVENDESFMLNFPTTFGYTDDDSKNIRIKIKAKELWNKIVHQATKTAEPGVLFWDTITNESIPSCYGEEWKETSTNPCVSEDTLVLTDKGYKTILSLVGKSTNVWNGKEFSKVIPSITGITYKWYIITFSDGSQLKCTPYHNFYLKNSKVQTKDLKINDKLEKYEFPIIEDYENSIIENLYEKGFYCGDGSIKRGKSIIDLYGSKQLLINNFNYRLSHPKKDGTRTRIYLNNNLNKEFIPDVNFSISSKLSYLSGLIDSDGSLNDKGGALNISSINKEFLIKIKYLLNTLGCTGTVSLMKKEELKDLPNGKKGTKKYLTKDCYRIIISASNVKKLKELGLKTFRVSLIANPNRNSSRFIKITNIETLDVRSELTYCFTETKEHKGTFNGIITGQCGEIPLCPYDSCRLMSVSLYSFVEHPFTDKAYFNYDKFKDVAYKAQRLMDDIVDLEEEKINLILNKIENDPEPDEIKALEKNLWLKIRKKLLEGRRTGLSAIGLADCFAACNIQYGNSESLLLAEEIYKQFAISAYKSSIDMAKERGAFPIHNYYKEKNNPFLLRIMGEINYNNEEYNGRRNICLLTIPPSGTISLLVGISSGIEPVYQLYYKRRRKLEKGNPKITFTDQNGDGWEEYTVLHPKFKEWMERHVHPEDWKVETTIGLEDHIKHSPWYNSTAYEIDPLQRIKLQATIQKFIDHSISSTINLPKGTTEETVSNLYMEAWKQGCKGLTIYVDECRTGVLVSTKEKKESKFEQKHAPKRPKVLPGELKMISVKGDEYLVAIGLLDGKPYEVMAGQNGWNIPKGYHNCDIIKDKGGIYRIEVKDLLTIENIITDMTDEQEAVTRLVSTSLRHGADVKFIVEQLNKTKGDLTSFNKAISRSLKKYIKDGETSTIKCDKCGSELVFENGCSVCKSCGESKCS